MNPTDLKALPALSIRQPWAWLIVNGYKPIENRSWSTKFRGELLIHASKTSRLREWRDALDFLSIIDQKAFDALILAHDYKSIPRGGIVGKAHITECVAEHPSEYFVGPYGFVMANAEPCNLVPCVGKLDFFYPAYLPASPTTQPNESELIDGNSPADLP